MADPRRQAPPQARRAEPGRLYYIRYALKMGWTIDQIHELTKIDPWFLEQMKELVEFEDELLSARSSRRASRTTASRARRRSLERRCFAEAQATGATATFSSRSVWRCRRQRRSRRIGNGDRIEPVYKLVDTCAAEFEAATPYYYSTYETPLHRQRQAASIEDEIRLTDKPKVIIIGGGPNRIGQGIEFDYCCVQAAFAMKELGIESVMINSNPETVCTDYDTSDLLFFEPLTHEDILNICERLNGEPFERRSHGAAIRGLGQRRDRPVRRADAAEPRARACRKPASRSSARPSTPSTPPATASSSASCSRSSASSNPPTASPATSTRPARSPSEIGYPVLVRPSFVLGGRAMEIVSRRGRSSTTTWPTPSRRRPSPTRRSWSTSSSTPRPKCDVDCLADFEPHDAATEADDEGRRSSSASWSTSRKPAFTPATPPARCRRTRCRRRSSHELKEQTRELAKALRVRGLMNVQYAIKDDEIYVIEVNPRASRTVPFVGKATGVPWAKIAAKVMAGKIARGAGRHGAARPEAHVA